MATPTVVAAKPPTGRALQYDGTNLTDFQTWLGVFPTNPSIYGALSGQQIVISGGDGTIQARSNNYGTAVLPSGAWMVIADDNPIQYLVYIDDAAYIKAWG